MCHPIGLLHMFLGEIGLLDQFRNHKLMMFDLRKCFKNKVIFNNWVIKKFHLANHKKSESLTIFPKLLSSKGVPSCPIMSLMNLQFESL